MTEIVNLIALEDIEAGRKFYDTVFSSHLGWNRVDTTSGSSMYLNGDRPAVFISNSTLNGKPITTANGSQLCIGVDSQELVDKIYQAAMESGGANEGEPGIRDNGLYAAYFRDLQGHKFLIYTQNHDL